MSASEVYRSNGERRCRLATKKEKKRIGDDGMIEMVIEEIIHSYKIYKATLLQRKRHIPFEAKDVSMYIEDTYRTNK